jgi:PAS domain S-box-containing protein
VLGSCHPRWEYPPDAEFPLRFVGNFLIHEITHMLEADSFRLDAEKYQHAYENIPCGMLILNKDGEIVECNDETASLLGFFNKNDLSGKFFWDFIARSNQNKIKEILANADEPRPIKNFGCSIVKNDGQEFQAELSINLAPISSGIPFQMIAAIHDVSSRQEVHHVLQESEKQLAQQLGELRSHAHDIETLTEMVNMLQICSNQDEAFAVFAKIGRQLFPNLAGSLLILDDAQIRMEVKARWSDPSLKEGPLNRDDCWALRRGRPYLYINTQSGLVCSHVGERLPESYLCTPIIAQGMAIGLMYLESTTDRASLAGSQQKLAAAVAEQIGLALSNLRLRESLREQAIRDPLTGLFNRYYMEESLARELSRARRSNKPIGVIMLDLDHFKELNTRFGHPNVDVLNPCW